MKKIIVMGMIALMTLSTLTGCVTKANAEEGSSTSASAGDENVINVYTAL